MKLENKVTKFKIFYKEVRSRITIRLSQHTIRILIEKMITFKKKTYWFLKKKKENKK